MNKRSNIPIEGIDINLGLTRSWIERVARGAAAGMDSDFCAATREEVEADVEAVFGHPDSWQASPTWETASEQDVKQAVDDIFGDPALWTPGNGDTASNEEIQKLVNDIFK